MTNNNEITCKLIENMAKPKHHVDLKVALAALDSEDRTKLEVLLTDINELMAGGLDLGLIEI